MTATTLKGKDGVATARHMDRGKEVCNKLEGGGSPPTFEQLHPLHSAQFTLLSVPVGQSSQNSFMQQKDSVPTSRLAQVTCTFPWRQRCLLPAVRSRTGLRSVARAAGAAEAGVVLVAAELGLQDQVAVGEVWLVHALSARVHNMIHSHCSQAKGEAAVNMLARV